jgi:hypothetical protein
METQVAKFLDSSDIADLPDPQAMQKWGISIDEGLKKYQKSDTHGGGQSRIYEHYVKSKKSFDLDASLKPESRDAIIAAAKKILDNPALAAKHKNIAMRASQDALLDEQTATNGWNLISNLTDTGGIVGDIAKARVPEFTKHLEGAGYKYAKEDLPVIAEALTFTKGKIGDIADDPEVADKILERLNKNDEVMFGMFERFNLTDPFDQLEAIRGMLEKYKNVSAKGIPDSALPSKTLVMKEIFQEAGFDSLNHVGGSRWNKGSAPHRVTIALDPSQIIHPVAVKKYQNKAGKKAIAPYFDAIVAGTVGATVAGTGRMLDKEE